MRVALSLALVVSSMGCTQGGGAGRDFILTPCPDDGTCYEEDGAMPDDGPSGDAAPAPSDAGPMSSDTDPTLSDATPIPSDADPMTSDATPAPSDADPMAPDAVPMPLDAGPMPSDAAPIEPDGGVNRPDAGGADAGIPGPVNSCAAIDSVECFGNPDCPDDQRCQDVGPAGVPVPCCIPGRRGDRPAGASCAGVDGQLECASGVCIEDVMGDDVCSGPCESADACPDALPRCITFPFGGTDFDWCFPP